METGIGGIVVIILAVLLGPGPLLAAIALLVVVASRIVLSGG